MINLLEIKNYQYKSFKIKFATNILEFDEISRFQNIENIEQFFDNKLSVYYHNSVKYYIQNQLVMDMEDENQDYKLYDL